MLRLVAEECRDRDVVKACRRVRQTKSATTEATRRQFGHDAVLLSMADLKRKAFPQLLEHARAIAATIRSSDSTSSLRSADECCHAILASVPEIENVVAIRSRPSIAITRSKSCARWRNQAAPARSLYTRNDDNILNDLLTEFNFGSRSIKSPAICQHWAVWTKTAFTGSGEAPLPQIPRELLTLAQQITDANAAIFDPIHDFRGCIPGIHEILRRQGLLEGRWCLDSEEELSPGQSDEIDRVCKSYPHLQDDAFVQEHLDEWLR